MKALIRILIGLVTLFAAGCQVQRSDAIPSRIPAVASPTVSSQVSPSAPGPIPTASLAEVTPSPLASSPTQPTMLPPADGPDQFNHTSRADGLSGDGRYLLFQQSLPQPGAPKIGRLSGLYLYDRQRGAAQAVMAGHEPVTGTGALSRDGRYIVYTTEVAPTGEAANPISVLYVLDRESGENELVSADRQGHPAMGSRAQITADGRFIVFASNSLYLTADPLPEYASGVFLRDRESGTTTLISKSLSGQPVDGESDTPAITPDGRFIAFLSFASNLVPDQVAIDIGGRTVYVFVYDRLKHNLEQIPVGIPRGEGGAEDTLSLSDDGRWVVFHTRDPKDGVYPKVVVYDRLTRQSEWLCVPDGPQCTGFAAQISADGRWVAFTAGQVYLYDRVARSLRLVSHDPDGTPEDGYSGHFQQFEGYSGNVLLSADGHWLAFASQAPGLLPAGENKPVCTLAVVAWVYPCYDLFLYNRLQDSLTWIQPVDPLAPVSAVVQLPKWLPTEAAPEFLYIHADHLIRQSSGKAQAVAQLLPTGTTEDAMQVGNWVYALSRQAVQRVPVGGGKAEMVYPFEPPIGASGWLGDLVADPDGTQLALSLPSEASSREMQSVLLIDVDTGKTRLLTVKGQYQLDLIALQGGGLYYQEAGTAFGEIERVDIATGAVMGIPSGGSGSLYALAPDGRTIAAARGADSMGLLPLDPATHQAAGDWQTIPSGSPGQLSGRILWSPDSRSVYTVASHVPLMWQDLPFGLSRLNRESGHVTLAAALDSQNYQIQTFSEDGRWLWLWLEIAHTAVAVNLESGELARVPLPDGMAQIVRLP